MSKKKHTVPKRGCVWKLSAEEATLAQMPRYNAHMCKTGAHGSSKYDRAKAKRAWQKETATWKAADWRSSLFRVTVNANQVHTLDRMPDPTAQRLWSAGS